MRRPSWNSPWWVFALLNGVLFGGFETIDHLATGRHSVLSSLLAGVLGGVFFGLFMGFFSSRRGSRLRRDVGDVPVENQRAVARAAVRGPVPSDPAMRSAALRLATFQAVESRRQLFRSMTAFAGFAAITVLLAVVDGPLWLIGTAFFVGVALWVASVPKRLERRMILLRDAGAVGAAG
jgi:hypothetical protein